MKPRCSLLLIVLTLAFSAVWVAAQEDEDNYFTGNVVESAPDHLKVSRVLQGKTEERVFKMTAATNGTSDGRCIFVVYQTSSLSNFTLILIFKIPLKGLGV